MSESKKEKTIIDDHRQALMLSGNLSDWHINNLKAWPKIVFDDVKDFDLVYDFTEEAEDKDKKVLCAGKVIYNLRFEKEPEYTKEELYKRLEDLKTWVKVMFWKDTKVIIKKEGKKWI